jgi:hypothetical protein
MENACRILTANQFVRPAFPTELTSQPQQLSVSEEKNKKRKKREKFYLLNPQLETLINACNLEHSKWCNNISRTPKRG